LIAGCRWWTHIISEAAGLGKHRDALVIELAPVLALGPAEDNINKIKTAYMRSYQRRSTLASLVALPIDLKRSTKVGQILRLDPSLRHAHAARRALRSVPLSRPGFRPDVPN
jgi:hypothetical protein